jgi:hypothetical protein
MSIVDVVKDHNTLVFEIEGELLDARAVINMVTDCFARFRAEDILQPMPVARPDRR